MQVHYDEGVAIYIGPEPCVGVREDGDEASVGEGIGQPLSRESLLVPGADDPIRFQVTVTPGEFETFFERIAERNLTLADQAALAEVASAAGMDIVGPPLSDEEVAAIVGGGRV